MSSPALRASLVHLVLAVVTLVAASPRVLARPEPAGPGQWMPRSGATVPATSPGFELRANRSFCPRSEERSVTTELVDLTVGAVVPSTQRRLSPTRIAVVAQEPLAADDALRLRATIDCSDDTDDVVRDASYTASARVRLASGDLGFVRVDASDERIVSQSACRSYSRLASVIADPVGAVGWRPHIPCPSPGAEPVCEVASLRYVCVDGLRCLLSDGPAVRLSVAGDPETERVVHLVAERDRLRRVAFGVLAVCAGVAAAIGVLVRIRRRR